MKWRGVSLGVGALFVVFALVQLNDPDPAPWVLVYGMTALMSAAVAFTRVSWPLPAVWGGLCAFVALRTWLQWDGSSNPMGSAEQGLLAEEVVREALGLLLVTAWMAIVAVRMSQTKATEPAE